MSLSTRHHPLHLVDLVYQGAFLEARRCAGLRMRLDEEQRLAALVSLFHGDPTSGRRRYRRAPLEWSALIKTSLGLARAEVINVSIGGLLLECSAPLSEGEQVMVRIGEPWVVHYHFPCQVKRIEPRGGSFHVALEMRGIPLQVRYGGWAEPEAESAAWQPDERVPASAS